MVFRESSGSSESSDATSAPFSVRLFGPFAARVQGEPLPSLRGRKGEWLLALLAARGGRPLSRDHIAATLWPDSNADKALYNLRRTLHDVRHALGSQAWRLGSPEEADDRSLSLDLSGGAEVDVLAFEADLKRGGALPQGDATALARAIDCYTGPFLEGCDETWAQEERAVREEAYVTALERLATYLVRDGDPAAAAGYLRRALARDNTRETALRSLLDALAAAGDRASAVREYRDFRIRLLAEMNALPSPETRATYERIKAEVAAGAGTVPPLSSATPGPPRPAPLLEPAGGAVPLDSALYVERATDRLFHEAILRGDSVVLLKGPRQVGKSSLLSRGLEKARVAGCRVVTTDLQKLGDPERHLKSAETFLLALARLLTERLNLDSRPEEDWDPEAGPTENFERFLRRKVLATTEQPFVWALDEVDQLFPHRWASEVFGLFRSWHNERALEPDGPWGRLTLAMAYATEAHLFITDLNQSPFNVGTRLTLDDFTDAEVVELDRRLGFPLGNPACRARFAALVAGHPDLVRRGLQELATGMTLEQLDASSARDDGPFGYHLRRLLHALSQDAHLCTVLLDSLGAGKKPDQGSFYRLRSAGVLAGEDAASARARCGIYARYLQTHLPEILPETPRP